MHLVVSRKYLQKYSGQKISPRNSTGNRMISRLKENLMDHRTMTRGGNFLNLHTVHGLF